MSGFGVDRGSGSSSGSPDSAISEGLIDAKGDLIVGTAADTAARLAVGTNEQRLVAASGEATGLKYVADTTNYAVAAKGDLLVGTAADTVAPLTVGTNEKRLVADSAQATGLAYVADTTNYAVAAKGDLLVGTAADTVAPLTVGSDDQALIADAAQSSGMRWGTVPAATVRQTQLAGPVDSSGYNATLSAGAGLNFNVSATATNVVFAFAGGFGSGGAVDTYTQLTADASDQGSLDANNTHYISATRASASTVTWTHRLVPPQYSYAFDRSRGALLSFEAADASTTLVDAFGNTWTAAGNAQIDTAQSKFGTASLLLDGTGDYIESTNFTSLGVGSWEMSCWFRANATSGVHALMSMENATGFGACVYIDHNAGTRKVRVAISSNGTSNDVINAVNGTTTISLATWYKARLVFDALAGTYRLYLSNNGAAEVQDQTASSTSRVCAVTKGRLGRNAQAGTTDFDGWIDAYRYVRCATVTTTETPSVTAPTIANYPYHWFSLSEMKMYEVTSASASAGTNPGMTRRDRVFVGEADTDGSSVTAVRNYALRGEYVGALVTPWPSTSSTVSVSHNIGVTPRAARVVAVNVTTEQGYSPGDEVRLVNGLNAGYATPVAVSAARNSMSFPTEGSSSLGISPKAGGNNVAMTPSKWAYRLEASRGW